MSDEEILRAKERRKQELQGKPSITIFVTNNCCVS